MTDALLHWGLFSSFALFAAGALLSLTLDAKKGTAAASVASHVLAALGGLFGLATGLALLFRGETLALQSSVGLGIASGILNLRVDALTAFFIGIISILALAASVYGIGYQRKFYGVYRSGHFGFFYNIFLASMVLVVTANNALLFLCAWEVMAIVSYFLVIYERREASHIRAGVLYILITQLGTTLLFACFLILYNVTGSWDFDAIREAAPSLPPLVLNIVLALALLGFGTKAGMIPLHIWLPEAHPAAPSHVSALMSGVMIKTAIFMIIRFFLDFFPNISPTWGLIILSLGAVSSLLGVLYALSEHDIKRLLAFHSVENIGIILLGVGASITFFSFGFATLGVIALAAALFHTINHALFKGLLFLAAGSVVHATHTRNMEEYGGLIKAMPSTAFFFLIGAIAISGLPPLNGFASEWLTFQSLFAGVTALPTMPKVVFLIGITSLAFTGGLAAACFVKAFGATFLARPRHAHARVRESETSMQIGMSLLALLCVLFGVGATPIASILAHTAASLRHIASGPAPLVNPIKSIGLGTFSSLGVVYIALALLVALSLTAAFLFVVARNRRVRIAHTWDCGADLTPRMEITATGFSRSIITIFQGILRPTSQTNVEYSDASLRYFGSKTVHLSLPDLYQTYLYNPVVALVERGAREARRIQTGNLNTYLLYMSFTLIALLLWAFR